MGVSKILGKTVEALQLLRQPQSPLPKDARRLLVLIDGKRRLHELQGMAAANGVEDFAEALAYLVREELVQDLPQADGEAIEIDLDGPGVADANRITLDFALPPGALDVKPKAGVAPVIAAGRKDPPGNSGIPADASLGLDEIRARLMATLRPKIEAELREKLLPELREKIRQELTAKLEIVLRPHVERQLRAQLRAELKPQIEQEFHARLEAALNKRLQSEGVSPARSGADDAPGGDRTAEPMVLELDRDPVLAAG